MGAPVPTNLAFVASFPEYNGAPAALLTAKLTEAAARTSSSVFATTEQQTEAVMYQAAILLLASPYGAKMRSENPSQAYAYQFVLTKLQRSATMGLRVF